MKVVSVLKHAVLRWELWANSGDCKGVEVETITWMTFAIDDQMIYYGKSSLGATPTCPVAGIITCRLGMQDNELKYNKKCNFFNNWYNQLHQSSSIFSEIDVKLIENSA